MVSKKVIDIKIKPQKPLTCKQVRSEQDNEQEDKIVKFWSTLQRERGAEPKPEIEIKEIKKKRRVFSNVFQRKNIRPITRIKWPSNWIKSRSFLVLLFLFFLVLAAFIYFSCLGVEIQIHPVFSHKTLQETLIIDSTANSVDFSSKTIPGEILEQEGEISQQFSSSDRVLQEKKAQGIIRVYNNYHLPQILVATTRFLSPDEKLFRSKKRVYIPSETFLDIEVEAAEPGLEHNIGPSTFSVPGLAGSPRYTAVFGKSLSPMQGGFRGEVSMVSDEDLDRAEKILKNRLAVQLAEKLQIKAGATKLILADAISQEVLAADSLALSGTEAEYFNYRVKVRAKTLTLKKQDVEEFARHLLSAELSGEQRISSDSLQVEPVLDSINLPKGQMTLGVKVSAQVYTYIAPDELKATIVGKKIKQGQELLTADPRIFTAQVKVLPFWKRSFPKNQEKIKINVNIGPHLD